MAKIRLSSVHASLLDPLVMAARLALIQGLGPNGRRVSFDIVEEERAEVCVVSRAAHLSGPVVVELLTPTHTKGWTDIRDLGPLLKSLHGRAVKLGLTLPEERFSPALPATCVFHRRVTGERFSQRGQGSRRIEGVVGRWRVNATPAQAWWLALAEVMGAGKNTSSGLGVVRCFER